MDLREVRHLRRNDRDAPDGSEARCLSSRALRNPTVDLRRELTLNEDIPKLVSSPFSGHVSAAEIKHGLHSTLSFCKPTNAENARAGQSVRTLCESATPCQGRTLQDPLPGSWDETHYLRPRNSAPEGRCLPRRLLLARMLHASARGEKEQRILARKDHPKSGT